MPSKQLIELVDRLKKSGIQISFTKPRSNFSILIQCDIQQQKKDLNRDKKWKQTIFKFT